MKTEDEIPAFADAVGSRVMQRAFRLKSPQQRSSIKSIHGWHKHDVEVT